ncbi:MAG: 30S ribosomal protein S24e [Candidatus Methanoliparum thermophilum]|uniref:Small ribosomal subunit protein eS24 n=1 Tax=Methanoliparum thermophilum TaxID=2491083 RepID=A0A520KRB0_METT2|nr:hypothetical protein [Candidatus Methanoliparum sp. LAM-1]RZN64119.1 MAG: 30S ribosomal protein S24e [Candidatus Methanoliparum thermophilum]BDC35618.1 30S ribosomal protein S24e [Candidatus Methanoliparum sp. LAM-1]
MEIELLDRKKNKLLSREEIKFKVKQNGPTPKKDEMAKKLASRLNIDNEQLLVISSLRSRKGLSETIGYAKLYDDLNVLKRIEGSKTEER